MLGGANASGIDRLLAALQEFSGRPEATLIGRGQRADILLATLVNAHSQGVNAYNDTHLATVAHLRAQSQRRSSPCPSVSR